MSYNDRCKPNLALANTTLRQQQTLLKQLKSGELLFSDFLDETPDFAGTLRVAKVLMRLRYIHRIKVDKILACANLNHETRMNELTQYDKRTLFALASMTTGIA